MAGVAASIAALMSLSAYSDFAPAHRGYVLQIVEQQVASTRQGLDRRIAVGEMRQTQTQLQVNTLRRDALETQKFELELKLRSGNLDTFTQNLVEQQLRRIKESLDETQQERAAIRVTP